MELQQQQLTQQVQMTGDSPQPRFGHTITLVSKTLAVLFGGAIGDTGKYTITGDTYAFNLQSFHWTKLTPNGQAPQNRAAHCALCIDNLQMIIFGGAVGGGGLADDNLYALDLKNGENNSTWLQIPVVGSTPGRRYGHAMVFIKPFLLVNGGNTGAEPVNDCWSLNLEKAPYNWTKLECGESPPVRVYHSAALCSTGSASGMMVIFGGRTADQSALNDTWGLRRHRDGRWDWVRAPYKASGDLPTHRYQHSTLFMGSLMFVLGGRSNQVGDVLPFEIYDTESSDWYKFQAIQRFRHTLWVLEGFLYIHGGFDQDTPNIPTESMLRMNLSNLFKPHPPLLKQLEIHFSKDAKKQNSNTTNSMNPSSGNNNNQQQQDQQQYYQQQQQMEVEVQNNNNIQQQRLQSNNNNRVPKSSSNQIRLAHQAEVATTYNGDEEPDIIKRVSIDKLQEERKKLGTGYQEPSLNNKQIAIDQICDQFISQLMLPKEFFVLSTRHNFFTHLKRDQISRLLSAAQQQFMRESIVIKINAPLKIFGNINGQFGDLMKFFQHFGAPCEHPDTKHDIEGVDYLFLGNYVNKGTRSVEVLLLLLAIKLKYPEQFHMLRGNQEDKTMTQIYGLYDECQEKFQEDPSDPNSIYQKILKVFDYMPLAALVEERILCVHGGIGQNIRNIEEIDVITRPLEIKHDAKVYEQKIPIDLLWSDPVTNENDMENQPNQQRDLFGFKQVIRFGGNRLNKFMNENGLNMIIRSHEPVREGFETMQNSVITIFSCTDYCGIGQNNAGVLYIKKNGEITPKIINSSKGNYNPEDRWLNLPAQLEKRQNYNKYSTNDQEEMKLRQRPPTPPRGTFQLQQPHIGIGQNSNNNNGNINRNFGGTINNNGQFN